MPFLLQRTHLPFHYRQPLAQSKKLSPTVRQTPLFHLLFPCSLRSVFKFHTFLKPKNFPLSSRVPCVHHGSFSTSCPNFLQEGGLHLLPQHTHLVHPSEPSCTLATTPPFTETSPGRAANDFLTSKNSRVFSGQILFWCS